MKHGKDLNYQNLNQSEIEQINEGNAEDEDDSNILMKTKTLPE